MEPSSHASTSDRTPTRTRVLMTAVLFTRDGAENVRIQDLSPKGARILVDRPLRDSCDAIFKRGAVFVAGRIVWSAPGKAGIAFYRELSEMELESAFNEQCRAAANRREPRETKSLASGPC